jgi:hypothetical protein
MQGESDQILLHAIATAFWPMLVFKGTTSVAGATASGAAVCAPIALAMASERPWSTAANTATNNGVRRRPEKWELDNEKHLR